MHKDKIYIIGSVHQADRVRSAAKYHISMRKFEVRCTPDFESVEVLRHIKNLLWADRIYIIPNADGIISTGIIVTKLAAEILGKKVEQHYTETKIKAWVHAVQKSCLYYH